MKLVEISISNYRSIKKIEDAKVNAFQAMIGENNAGKSNILNAVDVFLSAGAGGVSVDDFCDIESKIIIKAKFSIESEHLKKLWRPYMINEDLILEKHIWIENDEEKEKTSIKNEFHGYQAEPKSWFLSVKKIIELKGNRPKWKDIVEENNLPDYFINNDNCNKTDFTKALNQYLLENEVEYEEPDLSETQALGLQSNVVASLPKFYLLKAQSSYSEETDKRSNNTTFRKLMGDLTDRIIQNDPKYKNIESALNTINELLNPPDTSGKESEKEEGRLESLENIESKLKDILCNLMPSVEKVKLKVVTEDIRTIFSKGVELKVDDGVETDVLLKGHGLQRCIIFSLLQALILNERKKLIDDHNEEEKRTPIILAIEEPELYIHPQLGKLFYDVLISFSKDDQVIYTTHSPRFIDVYKYESIAVVSKNKIQGTKYVNCDLTQFEGIVDKKIFKGLTQLNSDVNELFFAKKVLVVEGPEDKIAVTETCKKTNKISTRTEEIDITTIVAGGKCSIPFFVRILNAFQIKYAILHDLDIRDDMPENDKNTEEKRNNEIKELAEGKIVTFPIKLEVTLGLEKGHFADQYKALEYFSNHDNINGDLQKIIEDTLKIVST